MPIAVQGLRIFAAGNVVARLPVVVARLTLPGPHAVSTAAEHLFALLPETTGETGDLGADGPKAMGRLAVLAANAILRRRNHPQPEIGRTAAAGPAAVDIAIEAHDPADGRAAVMLAAAILAGRVDADRLRGALSAPGRFAALHADDPALIAEARNRRIGWRLAAGDEPLLVFGEGGRGRIAGGHLSDASGHVGVARSLQPWWCRTALREAGLPVPPTIPVATPADAVRAARMLGPPVAVTAARTRSAALGGLTTDDAVRGAAEQLGAGRRPVLVQVHPPGRVYRLLVLDYRFVGAVALAPSGRTRLEPSGVHPDNRLLAERAARVLGISTAAVDMISVDIGRSFGEAGSAIVDLEAAPVLASLDDGAALAARCMFERLFPAPASGRIPIFAVAGPQAEACRLHMVHLLERRGLRVAEAGACGVRCGGPMLRPQGYRLSRALRLLVDDREADAAVVELDIDAVLADGLGYDRIDLTVMTGPSAGGRGASLVARLTEGAVLHCPDDPATAAAAAIERGLAR